MSRGIVNQFVALIVLIGVLIVGAKLMGNNSNSTAKTAPAANSSPAPGDNVVIATDKGDIHLELYTKDAPKTVDNFEKLADRGYYNGVIFHRVIKDFMIQTGDPTGTGRGGDSANGGDFADEINSHKIEVGTVAMANRGPNTNGSQFFIVTEQSQPSLDGHYTVFGHVTDGIDVVREIAAVPTDSNDKPTEDVKMKTVTIEKK
jgi:peptidyl-prolyl cis-trans isomerase-like 1